MLCTETNTNRRSLTKWPSCVLLKKEQMYRLKPNYTSELVLRRASLITETYVDSHPIRSLAAGNVQHTDVGHRGGTVVGGVGSGHEVTLGCVGDGMRGHPATTHRGCQHQRGHVGHVVARGRNHDVVVAVHALGQGLGAPVTGDPMQEGRTLPFPATR
jgi:hypothetical protein